MAERVKYLGVTMEAATAEVLARLDAERRVPTSGLWLYAIIRAIPYYQMLAQTNDSYIHVWLALAAQRWNKRFEILIDQEAEIEVRSILKSANLEEVLVYNRRLQPHSYWPPMYWDHDYASVRYIEEPNMTPSSLIAPYWDKQGQDFVITPVYHPSIEFEPSYESVVVGGAWRLYGGRKVTYLVSDREKLVAILLAAMQPTTLALGMNVVFDGKMKPQKSKINFSGTGGQIGEGDVLICHPDDLNRYSPLPGAVALVLGDLTDAVQAFTCALPVGDEVLTIVIK